RFIPYDQGERVISCVFEPLSRFHRQFRAGVQEMTFTITPSQGACGATISGLDLSRELDPSVIRDIREAWLRHHVLAFPDQNMDDEDLERFSLYFGSFAGDPYIAPLDDRPNVIEIRRTADETTPIFADAWHTDWSFG